ncbi:UNVERIFIED_CONTAM: Kolavenyl diphosphate synthase TPS5, chloroplastic [Sesamum calycinum]|uniref:Kolavenyl diphosphate synthase TPS5, chloroplastic n=1 Tax=Sesamum calycinum TaxID=2727403 RepID=A0AAW2SEY4_9LAMI
MLFIKENIERLEDENEENMTVGFEVAFPTLMNIANKLGIDVPNDFPGLRRIHARRDLRLTKIPWDILHKVPTALLYSLEGMQGLDWQKLLKLQSVDGSFLFSPASTAFALQQTKDENCLKYLAHHVKKFNGEPATEVAQIWLPPLRAGDGNIAVLDDSNLDGDVPNVYPVDLFERLWAIDRLLRLGISRYFQFEIDECIDYVHRYWTNKGICWARNSQFQDIDDTAMGFRLLRLHGYEVSADVFKHFENGGEFFCFVGQSDQAVTGIYNLYRASQVGYTLDVPWYASLPRLETRFFLEQYGGDDDVWIGKTLYRMLYVNNNTYLELAKLDYNNCQALHQHEWKSVQKWYRNCGVGEFGLSERSLLQAYYIAAASIFEPEKSGERLAWAKTAVLVETIVSHFDRQQLSRERKRAFVNEFRHGSSIVRDANGGRYKTRKSLVGVLIGTVSQLSLDILLAHNKDIYQELYHAWEKWLRLTWEEGSDDHDMGQAGDSELFVQTLNLSSGECNSRVLDEFLLSHPKYQQLLQVTTRVCHHLRLFQNRKVQEGDMGGGITAVQIESDMQELVKLVLPVLRRFGL